MVGNRAQAVVAGVVRRHGLSHAALNALAVIEGAGGPVPTGVVATHMHITSGTVTTVLDTLERHGLISRIADPEDRRKVLVDITPAAQDLLDRMLPEIQQVARCVMGVLDDEALERLLGTLAVVGASIDVLPDDLPAPAPRQTPPPLRRG